MSRKRNYSQIYTSSELRRSLPQSDKKNKPQCSPYEKQKQIEQIKQINQIKQKEKEKQEEIYRKQNKEFSIMKKEEWEKNIKDMFQDLIVFDKIEKEFQMVYDDHAIFLMKNNQFCKDYFQEQTCSPIQEFESYINVKQRLDKKK
jgi:hypothetical protein